MILGGCQPLNATTGQAPPEQRWSILPSNGSLTNAKYGCAGVSSKSGPPSTIWSKPLTHGRIALLVINGADIEQQVKLDFGSLLGDAAGTRYAVRDVWAHTDEPAPLASVTAAISAHDCAMFVLSKQISPNK